MGFEDVSNRADFKAMGRMDGDGLNMGNEFRATPVGSAMTLKSQHDEVERLKVEVQSLKDANDRVQTERDTAQAEAHGWCVAFDAKSKEMATWIREVDRLRHQTREARTQPSTRFTGTLNVRLLDGVVVIMVFKDGILADATPWAKP